MIKYTPINAFQRNADGTMHRIAPNDNNNTYPPNSVPYNPEPMVPQRTYEQYSGGGKLFTGEVTPINPYFFCRNGEAPPNAVNPFERKTVQTQHINELAYTPHVLLPQFGFNEVVDQLSWNKNKMPQVENSEVNVSHGRATVSDTTNFSSTRDDIIASAMSCRISYFNRCPFDIVVVERSGLRQVVKSYTFNHRPAFIVKRSYNVSKDAYKNLTEYFNYVNDESLSSLMQVFKTQFFEAIKRDPFAANMVITIENCVDANQIKQKGDIYFISEDLMLSDKPLMQAPEHPFNSRNFNTESFNHFSNGNGDIGINFELVDNEGLLSERFIMLAKKIYRLSPKKDTFRQDGLYLTLMERDIKNPGKKKPIQSHYPLESLEEKFGIYKTEEEALAGGDIVSLRKEAISKMEHEHRIELQNLKNISLERDTENNTLKQELQKLQTQADTENQLRKERMARIEQDNREKDARRDQIEQDRKEAYAERERERSEENSKLQQMNKLLEADLDRQRSMMKDFYEGRSYAMKNTNEIIKWVPAMLTAIFGIIGIVFMKTKTT